MARYRVIQNSFINGHFLTVDEEMDYSGIPGFNLEPLDDEARSDKEKAGQLAQRDVSSRAFQEDLTRPDGAPPQHEDLPAAKADEPAADEKAGKKTSAKG
ncbi:hypothetical protein [Bombella apis]|uniref:hypothetical protein n=1 Tax=Bombella apis TaxID=1785988 RepID=UPI0024A99F49|nr:hypothetical protein [Bombella apis]